MRLTFMKHYPFASQSFLAALVMAALPTAIHAAEATPQEKSSLTWSSNFSVASQNVFRGLSLSKRNPVLQGGLDVRHASGFYAGTWSSMVSRDVIHGAKSESDFYAGFTSPVGDSTVDVGLLKLVFPHGRLSGQSYNTVEAYAALKWNIVSVKYSRALTGYLAFNAASMGGGTDSKGSDYAEANVDWQFAPGWGVNAHVGHQRVAGYGQYSYTDYKVGLSKDFLPNWQWSLAAVSTSGDASLYRTGGVNIAGAKAVFTVKGTF